MFIIVLTNYVQIVSNTATAPFALSGTNSTMKNSTVEHLDATINIGVIAGGVLGGIAILICSVSMAFLKRFKSMRSWLQVKYACNL
jgi:hypothetical protein